MGNGFFTCGDSLPQNDTKIKINTVMEGPFGAHGFVGKIGEITRIGRLVIATDETGKTSSGALFLHQNRGRRGQEHIGKGLTVMAMISYRGLKGCQKNAPQKILLFFTLTYGGSPK